MPSGTGKTHVATDFVCCVQSDVVICIAPLIGSVENLYDRMRTKLGSSYDEPLRVGSMDGGTTDIAKIREYLTRPNGMKKFIYVTDESFFDVVAPIFKSNETLMAKSFLLYDEAHHLVTATVNKKNETFNAFPCSLVMSATYPRQFEELFPHHVCVYKLPLADAIRMGLVCNYQVVLPERNTSVSDEVQSIYDKTNVFRRDLVEKAMFLANGMLQKGSKRCVVYLSRREDMEEFEKVFHIVAKNLGVTSWIGSVDCKTKPKKRKELLMQFEKGSFDDYRFHLMLSVQVLDEAIDLPTCDSTFVTSNATNCNDIRLIQRLMRGGRLDPLNDNKDNYMYLWAEDESMHASVLANFKEFDPGFHWEKQASYASVEYLSTNGRSREEFVQTLQKPMSNEEFARRNNVTGCDASEWLVMLEAYKAFVAKNNRQPTRMDYCMVTGRNLGYWVENQRNRFHQLSMEQQQLLLEVGFKLRIYDESWMKKYENVVAYMDDLNLSKGKLPKQSVSYNGHNIGVWLKDQMADWETLTKERQELMI